MPQRKFNGARRPPVVQSRDRLKGCLGLSARAVPCRRLLKTGIGEPADAPSEDSVRQMLLLAEQLRVEHGGELDDAAILAVSEACCLPQEYVRLAVNRLPKERKGGLWHRIRNAFLALDTGDRRYVISGALSAVAGLANSLAHYTGDRYGLFGTLSILIVGTGLWNVAVSPNARTAAFAGGLFGLLFFVARSAFAMVLQLPLTIEAAQLVPYLFGGALGGLALFKIVDRNRARLGLEDPQQERERLLRQLVDLQEKLREGEQSMTFLSLDVVGSTKMKEGADPLSLEFTFREYHKFVEMAARRFGGRVHSTAGDGVTCAFPHPQQAFQAARFIQAGIVELNTFRNKIGVPIRLRAAIHSGTVVAPPGQDISKISFAHVIDIAAHLQKASPVGGIAVSVDAARYIAGGGASVGTDIVEAQSVRAFVWQPRAVPATGGQGPPPLPAGAPSLASPPPGFDLGVGESKSVDPLE